MKLVYEKEAHDGGIWGPLLEKVWAKTNGYYKHIVGGLPEEAFDFLTGAPSRHYVTDPRKVDSTYQIISHADMQDYIITCTTAGEGDHNKLNAWDLPKSHAYSLINTYTLKDRTGKVAHRLYMIRNPWRQDHELWNGPWNDKDTKRWTEDYKRQVPYKDENDGVFFVEDKDFDQAFNGYTISYYQNDK